MFEIIQIVRLTPYVPIIAGSIIGVIPWMVFFIFFLTSSGKRFENYQKNIFRVLHNKRGFGKFVSECYFGNVCNLNLAFQAELTSFQIIMHPIEFRIFNTFALDYKLLYKILSLSLSYLIVFTQTELNV